MISINHRDIERKKEITHAESESKRLGISIEEYWKRKNNDTRKRTYENRDKSH